MGIKLTLGVQLLDAASWWDFAPFESHDDLKHGSKAAGCFTVADICLYPKYIRLQFL